MHETHDTHILSRKAPPQTWGLSELAVDMTESSKASAGPDGLVGPERSERRVSHTVACRLQSRRVRSMSQCMLKGSAISEGIAD